MSHSVAVGFDRVQVAEDVRAPSALHAIRVCAVPGRAENAGHLSRRPAVRYAGSTHRRGGRRDGVPPPRCPATSRRRDAAEAPDETDPTVPQLSENERVPLPGPRPDGGDLVGDLRARPAAHRYGGRARPRAPVLDRRGAGGRRRAFASEVVEAASLARSARKATACAAMATIPSASAFAFTSGSTVRTSPSRAFARRVGDRAEGAARRFVARAEAASTTR